jgi:sugar lactone lactonase YvrE
MHAIRISLIALLSLNLLSFAGAQNIQRIDKGAEEQEAEKKPGIEIKTLGLVAGFEDWVTSVAWSPDGKIVAAGSYDQVKLIDPKTRKATKTLKTKGFAHSLAFSSDSKHLAVGRFRGAEIWDVETAKIEQSLEGHNGYVMCVRYSPDGKTLATSGEDGSVRLWDAETGKEQKKFPEAEYPVMGIAFSPDGSLLALALGDETRVTQPGPVEVWDIAAGTKKLDLEQHEKVANSVAFSIDGRFLVSSSTDEKINVYDIAAGGKALGFFNGHNRQTNDAQFLAGTETVISAGGGRAKGGNLVIVWNRTDGEEIAKVEPQKARITSLALSPDQKTVATGSYDNTVAFLDLTKVVASLKDQPAVVAAKVGEGNKIDPNRPLKAGIIGLDTSHVTAFTNLLNGEDKPAELANIRIVAAYPKGSPDIKSSVSRVPQYTEAVKAKGVEIVDSIEELVKKVDVVFLETNDGRPHLEQVLPVLKAKKPVFIDKPIAGSLSNAVAIFEAARRLKTPVFSSSSLRYMAGAQAARNGELVGKVQSAETYSPCIIEPTHPDLFWYGIHGVEALFTVMGTGLESVKRPVDTLEKTVVIGTWQGERTGTFTGHKKPQGYGGKVTGPEGTKELGEYQGYKPLLIDIVKFFRTGKPPVTERETLEIYAFMEAADQSKRAGGAEVQIKDVMEQAESNAKATLERLLEPAE